jgi:hypothetical protein
MLPLTANLPPAACRYLELLEGFMLRPHLSLASVGVAAYVRLVKRAGDVLA